MEFSIPKNINDFKLGIEYQVLFLDGTWSGTKILNKMCYSIRTDLLMLIEENRVRIIKYENNDNSN